MKWNVDDYTKHASYVSEYGEDVLALLDSVSGEHILDLGCGDGELAEKIALSGCKVTAIDSSKDMIHMASSSIRPSRYRRGNPIMRKLVIGCLMMVMRMVLIN